MDFYELNSFFENSEIVEMGQYFEEDMPVYPTHSKFFHMTWHRLENGDGANDFQITMNEHNGTHVDSFAHYLDQDNPNYKCIDQIDVKQFSGICRVIIAQGMKEGDTLSKEFIEDWEKAHGEINKNDIVLISFGWEKYWALRPNDKKYITGWPGVGQECAQYLAQKGIKMIGVDTLGVDCSFADGDPAHNTFLPGKILVLENLRNIPKVPDKSFFMMLPLLIRKGSASPVRPIAFVHQKEE